MLDKWYRLHLLHFRLTFANRSGKAPHVKIVKQSIISNV